MKTESILQLLKGFIQWAHLLNISLVIFHNCHCSIVVENSILMQPSLKVLERPGERKDQVKPPLQVPIMCLFHLEGPI